MTIDMSICCCMKISSDEKENIQGIGTVDFEVAGKGEVSTFKTSRFAPTD